MSSFDINRIASCLLSTKIKDRNDGLNSVENLVSSKFKLNPKQFDVLVISIFKLIENEQINYMKNRSSNVESRLAYSSNVLKLLIEKSLDYNQEFRNSGKPIKLKFKFYMNVIYSIRNFYFIEDDILEPCSLDFIKILSCIVCQDFFKEHLTYEDWLQIYNLIVKVANFILNDISNINVNEKLLIEIYTSLHYLIQADSSISVNYLQLVSTNISNNYFKLLNVILRTCNHFKKESILTVLIFKIINKLIITLCTEDFKFVNKLIQISIKLIISFHQTQLESLQIQFLIFMNLSATHDFLDLHNFPKLIGDSSFLLDDPFDNQQDISIRSSDEGSNKSQLSIESITDNDSDEVVLYNVGILVQNLVSKLYFSYFQLKPEDVGFIRQPNERKSWFMLRSIYLRRRESTDVNTIPWLFNSGLAKLINSYFQLKKSLYEKNTMNSLTMFNGSVVRSDSMQQTKRQKLSIISESLYHSNNIQEFCNKLINDKTDFKVQQAGMQILVFNLEAYSNRLVEKNTSSNMTSTVDSKLSDSSSTKNSSILDLSESTLLNSTFDLPLTTHDSESQFNSNVLFKNVLNSFDNDELNYWSLMATRAIIYEAAHRLVNIDAKYYFQLLKIVLQFIKYKELSRISCSLVYLIISCNSNEDLNKIVDKSLITQIDNLIDLSEINGPFVICKESFLLWYSIHKLVKIINLSRNSILAGRIQDWFISKWNIASNNNIIFWHSSLNSDLELVNFICWLCGISIRLHAPDIILDLYNGSINEVNTFMDSYDELKTFFINSGNLNDGMSSMNEIEVDTLSENKNCGELLTRIIDVGKNHLRDELNPVELLEWAILEVAITELLEGHDTLKQLVNAIQCQATVLLENLNDVIITSEIMFKFMKSLNRINFKTMKPKFVKLLSNNFDIDNFFDKLKNVDLINKRNQTLLQPHVHENNVDMFDDEFNSTNEPIRNSLGFYSQSTMLSYIELSFTDTISIETFKCYFIRNKIHENDLSTTFPMIINYLEDLSSQEVLYCLYYLCKILENGEIDATKISTLSWTKIVRILGEGALTSFDLERDELTIIVVSNLLIRLFPVWHNSSDDGLKKDCYDMCSWLLQCGTKNLILTEASCTSFLTFVITFLKYNDQTVMENSDIRLLFTRVFTDATNNIKIKIAPGLVNYLKSISISDQMAIYRDLFLKFETPQQSIESCGTFCLFFSIVSETSIQVMIAVIFNFMEYSRFDFFLSYLKTALTFMYKRLNLKSSRELFNLLKFEILKSWWSYNLDIERFPYDLFGYNDISSFFSSNYKEITAISISSKKNDNTNSRFLETISSVRNSDLMSLHLDSLTLAIPLAYTRDCIRNEIYGRLANTLNDQFRFQMKEKLTTIIFEVIKFTDMSNERLLRDLWPKSEVTQLLAGKDSQILEIPGLVSISLHSSLDLIKGLVEKYSTNPKTFWHESVLYFLFRQISILFGYSINEEQRLLCLRKVKLIIILGHKSIFEPQLVSLIISTLSPFLNDPYTHEDVANILSIFRLRKFIRYNESEFLPLTVKLASCLFDVNKTVTPVHLLLLGTLEEYINSSNKGRKIYSILEASIDILNTKTVKLTSSNVEMFLNDETELNLCKIGVNNRHIIKLISLIFEYIKDFNETGLHENVVKLLLNQDSHNCEQSKKFTLWSAEYLANYYLNGGAKNNISHFVSLAENEAILNDTFEKDISSMDTILDHILQYMTSDNFEIAACAESILGMLIWKYKTKKSDVQKFLNFDKYYNNYALYIMPLDFHSCILLNSNTDELIILGHSLEEMISDMAQSIEVLLFETWTSCLFLSIVQELANFTSIAPLFSIFATKVKTFSKSVLPSFICYYIGIMGKEGASKVIRLLSKFSKLESYKSDSIELFIQILLKIRIGAKKQISVFVDIYLNVNLECFYRIAASNKFFKTALMLFEDNHSKYDMVIDWHGNSTILSNIYESIDNTDLIYGLPEETSLEYAINMINRSKETSDQLKFNSGIFDANISFDLETKNSNILNSMIRNGFLGVSKLVSKSLDNSGSSSETFEWAWKLNCWDIPTPRRAIEEHKMIYKTLKQIHDYPSLANETCQESLLEMLNLKDTVVNCSPSPKEHRLSIERWLISLACVSSIRDIVCYTDTDFSEMLANFSQRTKWFELADFESSENILLARKAALQILGDLSPDFRQLSKENIWLSSLHDLIRYNSISIISKELQKLVNSIIMINEISKTKFIDSDSSLRDNLTRLTKYRIAHSLWHLGQTSIPVIMLKELQQKKSINLSINTMNITPSLINANLVDWMANSRQDLASNIMEKYVLPTSDMVVSVKELDQKAKVYEILANFCESQFRSRNINDHINKLEKLVDLKRSEIEELKSHYSKMPVAADEKKTAQRYYAKLKAQYIGELSDLNSMKKNISEFSDKAVEFYLKSILTDSDNDENLDKFFALWLEHSNKDDLHVLISDDVLSLPTHKLISWSTQLISRLSSESSRFQSLLKSLIVNLCYSHPYHSLYGLMSLRKHESYAKKSSNMLLISKSMAANNIWQQIMIRRDSRINEILLNVERFCNESIKLAEYKISRGKSIQLDKLKIGNYWLQDLPRIPPPSINLSIDLSTRYDNVIYLEKIVPKVTIASSGLSLPKIATFYLSNGSEHKILFKHGTDDLRQDSIMEQVFEKVNNLFMKDKETRKRDLRVRTYRAVPLGPETGVIEFVPNSIALIDAIRPYHSKMDDLKADKARDLMKTCQSEEKSERYKTYQNISGKISPVLRYFFFDNYVTPDTWFNCRTSYTRGIATTSMVGHILGLGDRHCNNILLDKNSGEPIHIDLGVAFDQGKRLPIPETVPFRLTRDIVDGFGITGVHGIFNKSCEHTYRVLRQNKDHILAILDVLRWDPLYSWSLSPIRRKRLQNEGDKNDVGYLKPQEDGSEGGRAVLMVSDKLTAGGLSVEAIVRELVQEATSPHNLALIYCGWCPFY